MHHLLGIRYQDALVHSNASIVQSATELEQNETEREMGIEAVDDAESECYCACI